MHFKFKHIQKIVGGFFLLTCIVIVILLVLVARGQRWFQQYVPYTTHISRGGGLHAGSTVMIQGLEAGRISRIGLDPDSSVRIEMQIFRQYSSHIREKSLVKLTTPMIGSSSLEIVPGPQDSSPIPPDGEIPSKVVESADLDTLIADATELVDKLKDPKGDLMESLSNVEKATKRVNDMLSKKGGTLGLLIEERRLYDELVSSTAHLDSILKTIDDSRADIKDSITEARRDLEEANKVIRALQKSIFLRGNIERYLKEDASIKSTGRAR